MSRPAAIVAHLARALEAAPAVERPWRHRLLADALPPAALGALAALPLPVPRVDDTRGKRETHNATRCFFGPEARGRFPVADALARALQGRPVVAAFERACGIGLAGRHLRVEYCLDADGFWLEPHTDIGAKKLTCLIYLSDAPGAEAWGTDLYDAEGRHAGTAPCRLGAGLLFVPGQDTWHGFRPRPIMGVRRSLIINYVGAEWRSRHELAFPDTAVA